MGDGLSYKKIIGGSTNNVQDKSEESHAPSPGYQHSTSDVSSLDRLEERGSNTSLEHSSREQREDSSGTHHVITRKKKPKRRSTGVVNFEDAESRGDSEDDSQHSDAEYETSEQNSNGELDYKKLWE